MKDIYFACSIRGGRDDALIYKQMIDHINTQAHVLSEIFADGTLTPAGSPGPSSDIHARDMEWVIRSDAIIAEVTNPSLGVGYEIGKAEELGKPILALFRNTGERKLSAMIDGSPDTEVVYYGEIDEAFVAINGFLAQLEDR